MGTPEHDIANAMIEGIENNFKEKNDAEIKGLAAIDDAGYNGIRDEHIDRVAESLLSTGLTEIDRATFDYHCYKCGIDPNNFTQENLERLQEKLNR